MRITENLDGKNLTLTLEGDLDSVSSPGVEQKIEEVLELNIESLNLDLSKVRYISSIGVRVLVIAYKKAMTDEKKVAIVAMSTKVQDILNEVGILPLFEVKGGK